MVGYTWRALLGHGREFVTVAQQPTDEVTPPAPAPALDSLGVCRQALAPESSRLGSGLQRAESALRRAEHICGIIGLRALGEWREIGDSARSGNSLRARLKAAAHPRPRPS